MNVYIGGDSFCYYRSHKDWPFLVSKQLGLELQGQGFPGDSWWHTRRHLLSYLSSEKSQDTDVFILCHTDPFRPLTGQYLFKNLEAQQVKQQYFRYFVDYEVSLWTTQNWYQELNQRLKNDKVLHFQCFSSSREIFSLLQGTRVVTPLVNLSLQNNLFDFTNDPRRNHFDEAQNKMLADRAVECLSSLKNDLEISL